MDEKQYLSADGLLADAFRLAAKIVKSGFTPTFMIALWRGGVPIGLAVQEFLGYHGMATDNLAIKTSAYHKGIDNRLREVRIYGLDYLVKHAQGRDSLLIVDDVFDTGLTIDVLIGELRRRASSNTPHDIRVAVPYYKPIRNQTNRVPDYYLHETDAWLMYPHSLEGLHHDEIQSHRPELYNILRPWL